MYILPVISTILFVAVTAFYAEHSTEFEVSNSTTHNEGQCTCNINAPSSIVCVDVISSESVTRMQKQVKNLTDVVAKQVKIFHNLDTEMNQLTNQMTTMLDTLERIEIGTLVVSRPEIIRIHEEIAEMEELLLILRRNHTATAVVVQLEAEVAQIKVLLHQLEREENADTSLLLKEIEGLKTRLVACQNNQANDFFQPWDDTPLQNSCAPIKSISHAFTLRGNGNAHGVWFRDPLQNQERIYYFSMTNGRFDTDVRVYPSVTSFYNSGPSTFLSLPENAQGPGMVAYKGSLYYNLFNSRSIARFNISTGRQEVRKSIANADYNSGRSTSENSYSTSGRYTDFDFAVDESGLWVIYSSSADRGVIVISKLNPTTLDIDETWWTNYPKAATGNCFIVCRALYCNTGYNSHENTFHYSFDMATEDERFINIPFDNKFLSMIALDYNPLDQKLYGWDNGHQVIYDLTFEN